MPTQDKTLRQHLFVAILLLPFALNVGCGKKNDAASNQVSQIPVPPPAPVVMEEPKEKPVYVYSGDRFRDPFMPAGQTGNYQPDAVFDPQRATVKGIIFGPQYKSAVLNVGGSGSYFIKDGRIFDIMGKPVDGYTAKVYADKVVLLGEADNVFELKIRDSDDKEKSL